VERIGHAVTQVDLRRVVRDEVDLLFLEKRFEVGLRDIRADEARARGDFSRRPAERSSTTTTRWPSSAWRLAMCEPMKPAPPVTRMFI
jgi:hypothetical protein